MAQARYWWESKQRLGTFQAQRLAQSFSAVLEKGHHTDAGTNQPTVGGQAISS